MKDVMIKTKSIPAQPRSKNYPTGASVVRSSSGNTTIIPGSSGDSVDIVKEIDIKSLTDKNVLSSLRTLLEIRSRIIQRIILKQSFPRKIHYPLFVPWKK